MNESTEGFCLYDSGINIAIIGMAGKFPGAEDLNEFWNNLCEGKESISFFSDEELKASGVSNETLVNPNYIKASPVIKGVDLFDSDFFGYTDIEANLMDPQQRLLLECAWSAMEDAGYVPGGKNADMVGVFVGSKVNTYFSNNLLSNPYFSLPENIMQVFLGNGDFALSSRISYKLGLKGPSLTVQSACTTSLSAIHLACQSLLLGESKMCIAGGVAVSIPHEVGYHYQPGGILSNDGHSRPFDEKAGGIVFGNGLGVVVLKRLNEAIEDGDRIYAVIKGTAVNNDGSKKPSFTAPSVEGVTEVVLEALACSGVKADTISYVEAHGSGTILSDSIEIMALSDAFAYDTDKKAFCLLGSVKGNIGHLENASGMAGFIKTVLSLYHKRIPATINYNKANPDINFDESPFTVNTELTECQKGDAPRKASINSFGFGGTNAHVILEEAPVTASCTGVRSERVFVISARTSSALLAMASGLLDFFGRNPNINLDDVAYTLGVGRKVFGHRFAFTAESMAEACDKLRNFVSGNTIKGVCQRKKVAFDFCDYSDSFSLSKALYEADPLLREKLDENTDIFKRNYYNKDFSLDNHSHTNQKHKKIALFIYQYSFAEYLSELGIVPEHTCSTGFGEYARTCFSGELKLKDAFELLSSDSTGSLNVKHASIGDNLRDEMCVVDISGNSACMNDAKIAAKVIAKLWENGCEVDFKKYYENDKRSRISLPSYPFERKRHWIEPQVMPLSMNSSGRHSSAENYHTGKTKKARCLNCDYIAPCSENEKLLCKMWENILDVSPIGVCDDFFEMGGHSILAMQIVTDVWKSFGVELPIRELSSLSTVRKMAEKIKKLKAGNGNNESLLSFLNNMDLDVSPEEKYSPFPLTSIQEAYWVGRNGNLELGNISTHSYIEYELSDFDVERFERTVQTLVKRHPALRTVVDENGFQRVLEETEPYKIECIDLQGMAHEEAETYMLQIRDTMSHQVFDTKKWPLFDMKAILLGNGVIRLHLSIDLILADVLSLMILSREARLLYENPDIHLESINFTFRDYVINERKLKDTTIYKKSYEYWKNRLDTLPDSPSLPLKIDTMKLEKPSFVRRCGTLENHKWNRIKKRCAAEGLTPSAFVASVFAEVLALYSHEPYFTINLTMFMRIPFHEDINSIVGDFTTVNLLMIDSREGQSFLRRAKIIQERLLTDLDNRYYSGVNVIRDLVLKHGNSNKARMPIVFTSMLNYSFDGEHEGGFTSGSKEVFSITQTSQVWLDHVAKEQKGALVFSWDAVEEIFSDDFLDVMFESYKNLLNLLSEDESCWEELNGNICQISKKQLGTIELANNTEAEISDELLHTLFIKQVKLNRNQVAVISEGTVLSYGKLYDISVDIGIKIHSLGAQKNMLVAVVMDKGWEQIAASIGILFGGAAYMPVSSDFPEQRILDLLKIGNVSIVLTQPHLKAAVNWSEEINVIEVHENMGRSNDPSEEPLVTNKPEDLAYVIFTSGSTGTPKGVMIDHRGAVNTIVDINRKFDVGLGDRVLALSSHSFDLSVYDIFGILSTGASVVVPPSSAKRDPEAWVQFIEKYHVTVWNSVPALMQIMVEYLSGKEQKLPNSMRLVLLSGDWIPVKLARVLTDSNKDTMLISLGGATEASIWSIYYPVEFVDDEWSSIPYGKPLSNQRVYVLNKELRHCPYWVEGDIYIAGLGLAVGYWNDSARTADSFITNPYTGERMYKTGDLGRYMPDGNIEFLGRKDGQVKIQGCRIELGEVEMAVLSCPLVKAAVAKVVGSERDNRRIVCYYIPKKTQNSDVEGNCNHVGSEGMECEPLETDYRSWMVEQIKSYVKEKLPDYMHPAALVEIDKIPLTPNGKVDRKALPEQVQITAKTLEEGNAPETELEKKVVEIWKEILKVDSVNVNESFFEMGGNSVHLIRALNKLKEIIDSEIEVVKLFEYPTIRLWCRYMSSNMEEGVPKQEPDSNRVDMKKAHHNRRRQARQVF